MNWVKVTDEIVPPSGIQVLVKYHVGLYDVLCFGEDDEYGYVAASFENYISTNVIEKYCLIED